MNLEKLQSLKLRPIEHAYTTRDTILYALGVGFGSDPLDESELKFVFEDGLAAVPSLCNTLAHPGFWIKRPELGIDWVKALHGEQQFHIHTPLPAEGQVRGDYEIVSIIDKGPERGALLTLKKTLTDSQLNVRYCTVYQNIFLRGDGGQGGFGDPAPAPACLPDRAPDDVIDLLTLPQAALIYRLSGDLNPLHASPEIARKAGFDRPILHGLATMGVANRALLNAVCEFKPERLSSMFVRFSKTVFPGETIRTEIFHESDQVRFRCRSVERDVIVLDRGIAELKAPRVKSSVSERQVEMAS